MEEFIKYIRVLSGPHTDYVVKWLGHLVQKPEERNKEYMCFITNEPQEVSLFLSSFINILGPDLFYQTLTPQHDYNCSCHSKLNKLLINISGPPTQPIINNLGSTQLFYKPKGRSAGMYVKNFARLVFTTSKKNIQKIEGLVKINVDDTKVYWEGMQEYLSQLENQKAILEYLRGI